MAGSSPSNREDVGDDLESNLREISTQGSEILGDEDYSQTTPETSGPDIEAQQGSEYQGATRRSALPELPATQVRLARLTTKRDNGGTRCPKDALGNGLGPAPRTEFLVHYPSLSESSTADPPRWSMLPERTAPL